MKCNSRKCMFYQYDGCVRTNIIITDGLCRYYSTDDLMLSTVFHHPVVGNWDCVFDDGTFITGKGHLIDVVASSYKGSYVLVTPSNHTGVVPKRVKKSLDMNVYLRYIDAGINPMVLESYLLDYFEESMYSIRIDCSGQFVHIRSV